MEASVRTDAFGTAEPFRVRFGFVGGCGVCVCGGLATFLAPVEM